MDCTSNLKGEVFKGPPEMHQDFANASMVNFVGESAQFGGSSFAKATS